MSEEKKCDYCDSMSEPIDLTNPDIIKAAIESFGENRTDVLARKLAIELFFHWYNSIKPGSKESNDLMLICRGAMRTFSGHRLSVNFTSELVNEVYKAMGDLINNSYGWEDLPLYEKPNKNPPA